MTAEHFAAFVPAKPPTQRTLAIIGAGPAGLIAAEVLATAGHRVTVYDRMPSPARKFLMAGRGGLNLTHSEALDRFQSRYSGSCATAVRAAVADFPPSRLIDWANGLDAETFVGSSGRVFPKAMKASPLLRAWLRRLDKLGVTLRPRQTWSGFSPDGGLTFNDAGSTHVVEADACVLALGGGSWPRLGSDGNWVALLATAGVGIAPLQPSNCGVLVPWSTHVTRHAGSPLKRIAASCGGATRRGEAVITSRGLEGGAIYALSRDIREALAQGPVTITIDLRADIALERLRDRIADVSISKSTTTSVLRKGAGLNPAAAAVVREPGPLPRTADELARRIKAVPVTVSGLADLDRAISTAGGITAAALDGHFMLKERPGTFVAGEILDFDAPTGGYLLQAAFSTGVAAARGVMSWLDGRPAADG